jgi:signal peptidase I
MLPTIKHGERLQITKLNSTLGETIARGDIVVFRSPMDRSKSYIKRVIGLPGDRIEIHGGEVWRNGSKLVEPYLSPRLNISQRSQPTLTVSAKNYFIMGDNRDNSADSTIWGCVPEALIYAKVVGK